MQSDLQPKYEAIDTDWAFLNLRSVPGMYRSIQELGEIFDREDQAQKLVDEFTEFYDDYKKKNEGKDHPKVMILMGLPGSYIIATPNSYVGSLVELAGGENVYSIQGALRFDGQGKFHPLKFLKAVSEDVVIFEHTKVRKATPDGVPHMHCRIRW